MFSEDLVPLSLELSLRQEFSIFYAGAFSVNWSIPLLLYLFVNDTHFPFEILFLGYWVIRQQLKAYFIETLLLLPGLSRVELERGLQDARVV